MIDTRETDKDVLLPYGQVHSKQGMQSPISEHSSKTTSKKLLRDCVVETPDSTTSSAELLSNVDASGMSRAEEDKSPSHKKQRCSEASSVQAKGIQAYGAHGCQNRAPHSMSISLLQVPGRTVRVRILSMSGETLQLGE